jgi:hypothetical protein
MPEHGERFSFRLAGIMLAGSMIRHNNLKLAVYVAEREWHPSQLLRQICHFAETICKKPKSNV